MTSQKCFVQRAELYMQSKRYAPDHWATGSSVQDLKCHELIIIRKSRTKPLSRNKRGRNISNKTVRGAAILDSRTVNGKTRHTLAGSFTPWSIGKKCRSYYGIREEGRGLFSGQSTVNLEQGLEVRLPIVDGHRTILSWFQYSATTQPPSSPCLLG